MTEVWVPQEALEIVWRFEQEPGSSDLLRQVAGLPPDLVAGCLDRGWLRKPNPWAVPELTDDGRAALRAWRRCWDCGEECVETRHDCPRRACGRQPYRGAAPQAAARTDNEAPATRPPRTSADRNSLAACAVSILFAIAYFTWPAFREASDFLFEDPPSCHHE